MPTTRYARCYIHGDPQLDGKVHDSGIVSTTDAVPICDACRRQYLSGVPAWDYEDEPTQPAARVLQ